MHFSISNRRQDLRKPVLRAAALLLAATVALSGCVSSKGDPVADLLTPDDGSVQAAAADSSTGKSGDPRVPTAEYASASPGETGTAQQPAAREGNMGDAVMQGTGINAARSSIFSASPQVVSTETTASIPESTSQAGFNATSASFFSASGKNPLLASASDGATGTGDANDDMEADDVPLILRGKLYSSRDLGPDPNDTATDMVTLASLPSMTRQSLTGLLVQNSGVQTSCFKPQLLAMLHEAEAHFGKRIVVTSGFRDPQHNARVGGAKHSQHLLCDAADIQMVGVSKWDLARYFRSRADIGGVGTYCSTNSIHVDIGRRRDWNWKCRSDATL